MNEQQEQVDRQASQRRQYTASIEHMKYYFFYHEFYKYEGDAAYLSYRRTSPILLSNLTK